MSQTQHPSLTALLGRLEALVAVDEAALATWALPRVDELSHRFQCSHRPVHDFRIWLREQYLANNMPKFWEGVL